MYYIEHFTLVLVLCPQSVSLCAIDIYLAVNYYFNLLISQYPKFHITSQQKLQSNYVVKLFLLLDILCFSILMYPCSSLSMNQNVRLGNFA